MVQWTHVLPRHSAFGFRLYTTEPNSFRNLPDCSNACSDLLSDVLIGVWFSGPRFADCATVSTPSWRQIGDRRQSRVELECRAHADDSPIFGCGGSAADESPRVIVAVVNNGKNGKTVLNDLSCRDGGGIRCLVKWPFDHRCVESPNDQAQAQPRQRTVNCNCGVLISCLGQN